MATQITITIANDTLGQAVNFTRIYDDGDRMVQAHLDQMLAQRQQMARRLPANQTPPTPTFETVFTQWIQQWLNAVEQASANYYRQLAQQAAVASVQPVAATQPDVAATTPLVKPVVATKLVPTPPVEASTG